MNGLLPNCPNWGPVVATKVLYNKARACAAASLSCVWGSANQTTIADSFKRLVLHVGETASVRGLEEVEETSGVGPLDLEWGSGAWRDPWDCQALISNMVIGSRGPPEFGVLQTMSRLPRGGGGVICVYLGQSL